MVLSAFSLLQTIILIFVSFALTQVYCATGNQNILTWFEDLSRCDKLINEVNSVIEKFKVSPRDSPYEIVVQKSNPGVYEVMLRGKSDQIISGFVLTLNGPPYKGTFSDRNGMFTNEHCDTNDHQKLTLIFSEALNMKRNQVVTYFYPRHARGDVEFRAVVYSESTKTWYPASSAIGFPIG